MYPQSKAWNAQIAFDSIHSKLFSPVTMATPYNFNHNTLNFNVKNSNLRSSSCWHLTRVTKTQCVATSSRRVRESANLNMSKDQTCRSLGVKVAEDPALCSPVMWKWMWMFWEDPTPDTDRTHRVKSELRGLMCTVAFMNLSISQKISPTPTPMIAEIRAILPSPTHPIGKKVKNSATPLSQEQSHPNPSTPLLTLPFSWQVPGVSLCLWIKMDQDALCSDKEIK